MVLASVIELVLSVTITELVLSVTAIELMLSVIVTDRLSPFAVLFEIRISAGIEKRLAR